MHLSRAIDESIHALKSYSAKTDISFTVRTSFVNAERLAKELGHEIKLHDAVFFYNGCEVIIDDTINGFHIDINED
tara:strand:+ start:57505 stop:57732 length:228 start_codon:yes stop_codon:yes gene_type:complete